MRILFTLCLTCSLISILPAQDTLVLNDFSSDTLRHMRVAQDSLLVDTMVAQKIMGDSVQIDSLTKPIPQYFAVFDEEFEDNENNWDIVRSTRRGARN